MFKVKLMRPEDFAFAVELANTMDWNMAPEDFEFIDTLEPEGCFVLFEDSKRIGIATSVSFGKVGWFGNLIVKEEYRGLGAGSFLVKHSVDFLRSKGTQAIGLYAYPALNRFYGNLGFRYDEDFAVMQASTLKQVSSKALPKVGPQQFERILDFDRKYFGGDRRKLLESIIFEKGNLSYYSDGGGVVGYVAATVYAEMAWVGPLICREKNQEAAASLLRATLAELCGKTVYLVLPRKETALTNMLSEVGFKEAFSVSRMFIGSSNARNCIYLAESLERG